MSRLHEGRHGAAGDFWSRRREAVRAEADAEASAAEAARLTAEADRARAGIEARQHGQSDAEILAGLGLKDPGSMVMGDDFAAFLRAEVPERVRRQALRRLWRSNPVLANLDGLVDHGEDYTDAATVRADMRTAYQVGRGIVSEVLALADSAPGEDPAAVTPPPAGAPVEACADPGAETGAEPGAGACADADAETGADADAETGAEPGAGASAEPAARPPRHMRFVYTG